MEKFIFYRGAGMTTLPAHLYYDVAKALQIQQHPELAAELNLATGERARLTTHFGHCHVVIRTNEKMLKGLVLVPQLWDTALEGMVPGGVLDCRLEKEAQR